MSGIKKHARPELIVCLFLVVTILAAYWQLPSHDFLSFDDNKYITQNTHVHEGVTWKNIAWAFGNTDFGYWHPLTWLSHMLVFQLVGLKSGMHHLTNLFFHIANALLLFLLLNRMTGALWQSAFVAAMFALHPLNVESVAWASERKNVLSTFFWMLTIWTYIVYTEHPGFLRYLLILFVFVLGLMAKPMLVTLPFVLLLLDYWPLCRLNLAQPDTDNQEIHTSKFTGFQTLPLLRMILEKIPLLGFSAICIYLSSLSIQRFGIGISTALVPMKFRIANALVSYVSYIKKMVWPHDLAVFYPYPKTLPLWQVACAGVLLACIFFLALRAAKSKPYLVVGWLWYTGTLIPVMGLVQAGLWPATADRFAYVPLIGLFMIIAWGVPDLFFRWHHRKAGLAVIAATLFPILMATTWLQVRYWENGVTLFTHNVRVAPNNSLAHKELGGALEEQGHLGKAIFHYTKALEINPNYAEAHNNLGYTLARQEHYKEAIKHYAEALRINPNYTEAHNNLGTALLHLGNEKDAIVHYYEAIKNNPNYSGAYYNLGKVFASRLNIEKAIFFYRKALELNPEMIQALYHLSWILASNEDKKYRNGAEAVKLAEKVCEITQYRQPWALDVLAAAYAETGKFDTAILTAQKCLELAQHQWPKEMVLGLKKRLALYKKGQPYRQNLNNTNES